VADASHSRFFEGSPRSGLRSRSGVFGVHLRHLPVYPSGEVHHCDEVPPLGRSRTRTPTPQKQVSPSP